ncbi:hypothetical protein [Microbulbifer thermotolerans]|uniref:Uncharacterized protein n=1 Tax=Microbulbifer thermotolerans TaxID=252514 RepID=A0A143HNV0_MICTH|nr:hypothetical protein [Microbulbifer thermotolerans]AMX03368.1 hypothetical protein A3224_12950 [Microbulbifer thermotolerans]MCX2781114.1 hypothetical protein [Microbulbifer thermotolerans]MCX2783002.1 hypothetical protein [Microbulbifer thermotolerans]MCX2795470.1 hypothetical protein [Microbulbifer thermotolerans]MCX2804731.1 hypothetical protein [Microbulbifer thermotolerans]
MIHLICNDDSYLVYTRSTNDAVAKLGKKYPFHINPAPISYASVWKDPLHLDFGPDDETTNELVPDIAARYGRLFLTEKAHSLLSDYLAHDGEFLPVTYVGGTGYIFNPLTIAEDHNAVDNAVTVFNDFGELESLGFLEDKLPKGMMVFRSKACGYLDVFCTDQIKKAIEDAGLVGVTFQPDLAYLGGPASVAH